ncbi:MAG: hypothetical protein AAGE76_11610, partial [Pseudomonadota bacterium]
MLRPAFALLAGLAACTNPVDVCVEQARSDYNGLLIARQIAEDNVLRGFAIDRDVVAVPSFGLCGTSVFGGARFGHRGFRRSGFGVGFTACNKTRLKTFERPVPIDIQAESAKLQSIEARLPVARELRDQRISQCFQRFAPAPVAVTPAPAP